METSEYVCQYVNNVWFEQLSFVRAKHRPRQQTVAIRKFPLKRQTLCFVKTYGWSMAAFDGPQTTIKSVTSNGTQTNDKWMSVDVQWAMCACGPQITWLARLFVPVQTRPSLARVVCQAGSVSSARLGPCRLPGVTFPLLMAPCFTSPRPRLNVNLRRWVLPNDTAPYGCFTEKWLAEQRLWG